MAESQTYTKNKRLREKAGVAIEYTRADYASIEAGMSKLPGGSFYVPVEQEDGSIAVHQVTVANGAVRIGEQALTFTAPESIKEIKERLGNNILTQANIERLKEQTQIPEWPDIRGGNPLTNEERKQYADLTEKENIRLNALYVLAEKGFDARTEGSFSPTFLTIYEGKESSKKFIKQLDGAVKNIKEGLSKKPETLDLLVAVEQKNGDLHIHKVTHKNGKYSFSEKLENTIEKDDSEGMDRWRQSTAVVSAEDFGKWKAGPPKAPEEPKPTPPATKLTPDEQAAYIRSRIPYEEELAKYHRFESLALNAAIPASRDPSQGYRGEPTPAEQEELERLENLRKNSQIAGSPDTLKRNIEALAGEAVKVETAHLRRTQYHGIDANHPDTIAGNRPFVKAVFNEMIRTGDIITTNLADNGPLGHLKAAIQNQVTAKNAAKEKEALDKARGLVVEDQLRELAAQWKAEGRSQKDVNAGIAELREQINEHRHNPVKRMAAWVEARASGAVNALTTGASALYTQVSGRLNLPSGFQLVDVTEVDGQKMMVLKAHGLGNGNTAVDIAERAEKEFGEGVLTETVKTKGAYGQTGIAHLVYVPINGKQEKAAIAALEEKQKTTDQLAKNAEAHPARKASGKHGHSPAHLTASNEYKPVASMSSTALKNATAAVSYSQDGSSQHVDRGKSGVLDRQSPGSRDLDPSRLLPV